MKTNKVHKEKKDIRMNELYQKGYIMKTFMKNGFPQYG